MIAIAALATLFAHHLSVCDDAYISFRYLDNWLDAHGLVYNPGGERVEGYTNCLWIVLLAPLRSLGFEPEVASHCLSALAIAILLIAVFRIARGFTRDAGTGWTAVVLVCGSVPVAYWAGSGMETMLFAALIAVANERLFNANRPTVSSSIAFGLATLTRPEGV